MLNPEEKIRDSMPRFGLVFSWRACGRQTFAREGILTAYSSQKEGAIVKSSKYGGRHSVRNAAGSQIITDITEL